MRKADLTKNHRWFEGVVFRYDDYLNRLLNARRVVRAHDKKEIAEGTVLKLCAYWESFVDRELLDCVNIDSTKLAAYLELKLPKHLKRALCRAIVFGDRFLDFRSIGNLKDFAN